MKARQKVLLRFHMKTEHCERGLILSAFISLKQNKTGSMIRKQQVKYSGNESAKMLLTSKIKNLETTFDTMP